MGYDAHHAVVVHIAGWVTMPDIARDRVKMPDLDALRAEMPEDFRQLCVGPIPTAINGDYVAVFLPDGSKEGWAHSDIGDLWRARFIDLFAWEFGDGSSPFDVASIRFGGDDPHLAWMKQRPEVFLSEAVRAHG